MSNLQVEAIAQLDFSQWIQVFESFFGDFEIIINFWVIALPWTIANVAGLVWNIFTNIQFNKWWAGGNVYLIANTVYGVVQIILSIILVAEVDFFLKYMKIIRWISVGAASLYVLSGTIGAFWIIALFKHWVKTTTMVDLFLMMMIFYTSTIQFPFFITSLGIIVKEISMEFWQILKSAKGSDDDISLNLSDLDVLNLFS